MTVFRVQDKEGRGPWRPGFSECWVEDRTDEQLSRLKPAYVEFPVFFSNLLAFKTRRSLLGVGCHSLDQLRLWFTPKEYATLLSYGYAAVKMEVDRICCESEIQCLFERFKPLCWDVEPIELYPLQLH